ncbi:MAG: DUF1156 domain-containing protein [Chloroflexi bacterium]|nr:DUF1156 domain-containing protein [Chloroflexota bacterium]
MTVTRKKLIEVALPLEAINAASAREKSIRHGHPSTLHLWWARRPLAAARAVIFSQMVDDPSSCPEEFATEESEEAERQRLFRLIEQLVLWENTTNESLLEQARAEIRRSWRRTCEDNKDDPRAAELFNPEKLPAFHDPFAGGGALPLEAQRLGLEAYASDLNPVAVLICKAMIEIPPKFAGRPPVNPESRKGRGSTTASWKGAAGLAEDVRYYGKWMRDEAEKRIGHLYPKVRVTAEMVAERPDLKPYLGRDLTVIAWLWARTVRSPNPAFANVDVPLASTFMLSTKAGKEAYVEPVLEAGGYRFTVKVGTPTDAEAAKRGTKSGSSGSSFLCLMSGTPMTFEYLRAEAKAGRMGARLMAIVADGDRGRVYVSPTSELEAIALSARPDDAPETDLPAKALGFRVQEYGMTKWRDLFTPRQLVALTTFSDLVGEARARVREDALAAGLPDDPRGLDADGTGAQAYADAVTVYLGLAMSRTTNTVNALAVWSQSREQSVNLFSRQAIPMAWDYPEVNPFAGAAGDFGATTASVGRVVAAALEIPAVVLQADAQTIRHVTPKVISTDPPYYDNVGYADLSDFFYVWQRRSLRTVLPKLFATLAVPKAEELVATPYRHGSKEKAEEFFLHGMTTAMARLASATHPVVPITIYYAFKQSEAEGNGGTSTGWETFLTAVMAAGFVIDGTWPIRTERPTGVKTGTNVLASSIVLVCRPRPTTAPTATRSEFLQELSLAMREALPVMTNGQIAPVDLAQASIGPGMAVYSKYSQVLRQDGKPVSVREALQDINNAISAYRTERTSSFDPKTRFCIDLYDQFGFAQAEFDNATVLARAQAVGVDTLENEHLLVAERGKAWLVPLKSYPVGIAGLERRFAGSAWEACMRLAATLQEEGESAAAALARELGEGVCARARELAVWLYTIADARKRSQDALAFNALDASWPEIQRLLASADRGGQQGRLA